MGKVSLETEVSAEALKNALSEAAKRVGWRVQHIRDCYETDYKLGSVRSNRRFTHTRIRVGGWLMPYVDSNIHASGEEKVNHFNLTVYNDEKDVERYLSTVSEILKSA